MRIGVLSAGGDCPGLNAAIRALARAAIENGDEALGIRRGYRGLAEGDFMPLDRRTVASILPLGERSSAPPASSRSETHPKRVDLGMLEIAKRFCG